MITTQSLEPATIRIDVGENFDFRLRDHFIRACQRTRTSIVGKIIVDLQDTCRVDDSGLALLMMLHDRALHTQEGIEVVNCSPRLRNRLDSEMSSEIFRVS